MVHVRHLTRLSRSASSAGRGNAGREVMERDLPTLFLTFMGSESPHSALTPLCTGLLPSICSVHTQ